MQFSRHRVDAHNNIKKNKHLKLRLGLGHTTKFQCPENLFVSCNIPISDEVEQAITVLLNRFAVDYILRKSGLIKLFTGFTSEPKDPEEPYMIGEGRHIIEVVHCA